jgi:hypothetical protein
MEADHFICRLRLGEDRVECDRHLHLGVEAALGRAHMFLQWAFPLWRTNYGSLIWAKFLHRSHYRLFLDFNKRLNGNVKHKGLACLQDKLAFLWEWVKILRRQLFGFLVFIHLRDADIICNQSRALVSRHLLRRNWLRAGFLCLGYINNEKFILRSVCQNPVPKWSTLRLRGLCHQRYKFESPLLHDRFVLKAGFGHEHDDSLLVIFSMCR